MRNKLLFLFGAAICLFVFQILETKWKQTVKRKHTLTFRSDKEKSQLSAELEDTHSQLEQVKKQKATSDKNSRALEEQLNELRRKLSAMEGDMGDSESRNLKLQGESSSLLQQLEEAEHKLGLATKQNKALSGALSEAKGAAEDESKVKIVPGSLSFSEFC